MPIACNAAKVGGITLCLCILMVVFSFLFGFAWDVVSPTEVGILASSVSKKIIDDTVYKSGRYFVGVGNYFIKFPITYQGIDFSYDEEGVGGPPLSVFTREGQTLIVEVSFFYRIDETRVHDLYRIAALNYEPLIQRKAEEVLKNVASTFHINDWFTNRDDISNAMRETLNYELYTTFHVYVPILQLRDIELPADLETALVEKVVTQQNQNTEILRRNITIIQHETEAQLAISQSIIVQTLQEATSFAYETKQQADAEVKKMLLDANSQAMYMLKTELGLNNTELVNLLFADMISKKPAESTVYVGFESGSVMIQN